MKAYLLKRLAHGLLAILGVLVVVFLLVRLTPGDPALLMLPDLAPADAVQAMRHQLGLDRSILFQFLIFVKSVLSGNLGESIFYRRDVLGLVVQALPVTVTLTFGSMIIALLVAIPTGVISATRQYSTYDNLTMIGVLLGQSVPTFWLGIMLILFFAVLWPILPTSGPGGWTHYVLPCLSLSTYMLALITRLTRSGMLEILNEDYVRTARAKGVTEKVVISKHALSNTMVQIVTVLGLQIGTLMGGAIITEKVFALPGVGTLIIQAIELRDYPVVQGSVLMTAGLFVLINFLVDVLYTYIDPRISFASPGSR